MKEKPSVLSLLDSFLSLKALVEDPSLTPQEKPKWRSQNEKSEGNQNLHFKVLLSYTWLASKASGLSCTDNRTLVFYLEIQTILDWPADFRQIDWVPHLLPLLSFLPVCFNLRQNECCIRLAPSLHLPKTLPKSLLALMSSCTKLFCMPFSPLVSCLIDRKQHHVWFNDYISAISFPIALCLEIFRNETPWRPWRSFSAICAEMMTFSSCTISATAAAASPAARA